MATNEMSHHRVLPAASVTLDSLLTQSTVGMRGTEGPTCCCGHSDCVYLKHNYAALEGLEKDLQSAAQIGQVGEEIRNPCLYFFIMAFPHAGTLSANMSLTFPLQALLARHEAYIKDAEAERRRMGVIINVLEAEKRELEVANAKTIKENRYLLDQLEEINNTVSDSDAQILSLTTTLESTQREIERLTVLAAQATHLESQLAVLENEQVNMQDQLKAEKEEKRTTIQRWKGAERTVSTLQEQVDRIEKEAKEERERHAEVLARFERRRAVDRELEIAAGRLKGAAAATSLEKNGNNNVVSHFVKDILQDNANLQLGIVELREMLMGSNQEVENLREQMMQHQPFDMQSEQDRVGQDLSSEIARTPTGEAAADFHVHHHYHAAPTKEIIREKPGTRRLKKRRNITSPGLRTPSSGTQTPRTPMMRPTPASSAATILSQTSVSIPPPSQPSYIHRWSNQSQATSSTALSSLPASPAYGSVFDNFDDEPDLSRPTTPGSTNLGSPALRPWYSKRGSDASMLSLSTLVPSKAPPTVSTVLQSKAASPKDDLGFPPFDLPDHSTIPEEPEDDTSTRPSTTTSNTSSIPNNPSTIQPLHPILHRASSHESLLAPQILEIPKLRTQRSQLLGNRGFTPRSSYAPTASIGAITSSTAAIGRPLGRQRGYDSRNYNRLLLTTTPNPATDLKAGEKATIGKRMGGWMSSKWGLTPTISKSESRAKEALSAVDGRVGGGDSLGKRKGGSRLSTHVEPVSVDERLLLETLGGV